MDLVVAKIDKAKQALAEAKDIQSVKKIADVAKAAEIYAKQQKLSDEVIYYAQEIRIEATRKMGEFLKDTPRNKGNAVPKGNSVENPTLSTLGIERKESSIAQKLASIPEEEVKAAIVDAKTKQESISPATIIEKVEKKETIYTFNETNENIEWAKWSWNPVTGCKQGCPYCYARDIANRFYGNFEPKFWPERLTAPKNTKNKFQNLPGGNNVFLCSMADLWGEWVPDEWIYKVLKVIEKSPEWEYLALTKNPKRYAKVPLPKNLWIGATADTQKRMDDALKVLAPLKDNIRFVSCEPLTEPIRIPKGKVLDWVIIGGRSRNVNLPEFQPKWEWVVGLVNDAKANGSKVYLKPNLRPLKEYPE